MDYYSEDAEVIWLVIELGKDIIQITFSIVLTSFIKIEHQLFELGSGQGCGHRLPAALYWCSHITACL